MLTSPIENERAIYEFLKTGNFELETGVENNLKRARLHGAPLEIISAMLEHGFDPRNLVGEDDPTEYEDDSLGQLMLDIYTTGDSPQLAGDPIPSNFATANDYLEYLNQIRDMYYDYIDRE